jgi:hypothetical protein
MLHRSRSSVDVDVLLRALAISAVVANHSQWSRNLSGGMMVLFMLSGFSFALDGRSAAETRASIAGLAWRVFVASLLLIAFAQLQRGSFRPLELLFVSAWTVDERVARVPVWYVQSLLQILAVLYGQFLVPAISAAFRERPLRSSAVLFGVGLAARALFPSVWDTSATCHHLPHLFLWNFALGWVVYYALASDVGRWKVAAFLAALAAGFIAFDGAASAQFWTIGIASASVLWIERVRLPVVAARAVTLVSQATFAVFLLHREFIYLYPRLPWRPWHGGVARWLVAMVGSVAVWVALTATWRAPKKLREEPRPCEYDVEPRARRRAA